MPRVKLATPTMAQIADDGWRAANKAVKKAMIDRDIKTIKELSEKTGISERTLGYRMHRDYPWRADELFRIAYALNMEDAEICKMFRRPVR